MNYEKHWLAVYTRPRWEKKVIKLLSNKHVENYCPLNRVVRKWADRKKVVLEPLITSYVFVHASEPEYVGIKETDGILNFVHWLGKPAIIKNSEIETLQKFLLDHTTVSLEKIEVNVNDEVKIIQGPLLAQEGKVVEVQYNYVKVMLPSLGYSLSAQVHKSHIEKVPLREQYEDRRYAPLFQFAGE
ncbi:UpxY family transcription antiterminator [Paraflavitalea sp. CAU 1676]|uniref:UpxY family transcription antiterminator n=1 Tax=Paraflavitalea sp. CAU 1676 TaxID=3032598 RepID=UPI0023DC4E73|nr:UpxY family transcription antiterminator [Paraflavitalea sp. CAU 1676]MDF2188452.1 UpxY family transcription antiterminator [Paraflavitalea sp. CAU 1676]